MSDQQDNPINLDLIQMVQRARMQHDDDAAPSKVPGVYWVEAKSQQPNTPQPTARSGEWRIPTTVAAVDALWVQIKQATEAGELGYKAKASTRPAKTQTDGDARMICVRTYDAEDTEDVERVADKLREMGLTDLSYQRD